jgi:hypothetical protein
LERALTGGAKIHASGDHVCLTLELQDLVIRASQGGLNSTTVAGGAGARGTVRSARARSQGSNVSATSSPSNTLAAITAIAVAACTVFSASDADLMGGTTPIMQAGGSAAASGSGTVTPLAGQPGAETGGTGAGGSEAAAAGAPGQGGGSTVVGGAPALIEAPIPAEGLVLWLTTDHGIGVADGGVAEWKDQSGHGHVAHQSIETLRPKLVTVLALNRDMIELDGVDDMLALSEGFADFSRGLTAFAVAVALDDRNCSSVLQLSNTPEMQDIDIGRQDSSIHYEVAGPSVIGLRNAFALNQTVVLSVTHEPTPFVNLHINGVFMTSGELALPEVMVRENNFIGRSLYDGCQLFKGRIGEILLYDRPLTDDERNEVLAYLDERWSYEPEVKPKPKPDDVIAK